MFHGFYGVAYYALFCFYRFIKYFMEMAYFTFY